MNIGSRVIFFSMRSLLAIIPLMLISEIAMASGKFYVHADQVRRANDTVFLKLSVWNCSNKKAVVELADLPWGENAIGLVVYAAGQRAGAPLSEARRIADFPIESVVIPPGSPITKEVNLSDLFPSLSHYKNFNNLVVFWVYDLSLIQGGHSIYVGGMLPFAPSSERSLVIKNPCRE